MLTGDINNKVVNMEQPTNAQIIKLSECISDMEVVAQGYFDIDREIIKTIKSENYYKSKQTNIDLIKYWMKNCKEENLTKVFYLSYWLLHTSY